MKTTVLCLLLINFWSYLVGTLPCKSIAKLHETVLLRKYQTNSKESAAKSLTWLLTKDDAISYVMHAGSCDEASQLVKIHRKRKSKGKKIVESDITNAIIEHQKFVKEVVLGLSLGNGEFLISVM